MSYAIRFLPADPKRRDEPAMYLSNDVDELKRLRARLTSTRVDVRTHESKASAAADLVDGDVRARCRRDRLVADVVPLVAALADLAAT